MYAGEAPGWVGVFRAGWYLGEIIDKVVPGQILIHVLSTHSFCIFLLREVPPGCGDVHIMQ